MDSKDIFELIKTVSNSNITNVEIEENGFSIKLKKEAGNLCLQEVKKEENKSLDNYGDGDNNSNSNNNSNNGEYKIISSPLVGTFYSSSSPEGDAFVKVGDRVKKGDTLCIVEAMKLMNEVCSEVDGEIAEVKCQNGSMVEYGQELFKIKC